LIVKSDFVFWIVVSMGTGAAAGMSYDNLPAGLSFGLATGIIVNLIMRLNVHHDNNK